MKSSALFLFLLSGLLISPILSAQQVPDSPENVSPLLIGASVPDIGIKTIDNKTVSLLDVVKEKPSIIMFYRGGWCPYCNKHMVELQKLEDDLTEMGYQLIAISVDRPEVLKETLNKNELSYTLLSDSPADVLKAFGIAFKVDPETVSRYKSIGLDLEKNSGYTHHILPAPAVYIVGKDGIIDFQYVNPNYKERISGEVLLTAARVHIEQS